jgi:hypothetical protein
MFVMRRWSSALLNLPVFHTIPTATELTLWHAVSTLCMQERQGRAALHYTNQHITQAAYPSRGESASDPLSISCAGTPRYVKRSTCITALSQQPCVKATVIRIGKLQTSMPSRAMPLVWASKSQHTTSAAPQGRPRGRWGAGYGRATRAAPWGGLRRARPRGSAGPRDPSQAASMAGCPC